jgi:hypothetical protein
MSKSALESVVQKAMSDQSFRAKLKQNPESALAGYDLTAEEKAAITSGSAARLQTLGVDERITKSAVFNELWGPEGGNQR